ncbi:aldo/keto reductase [Streptococcus dentiloxodontae]
MEYKKLNNGLQIPVLGFGVWQMFDLTECQRAVEDALETGYRLIDTAALYKNEEAVGAAVRASGISRKDITITTKAWINQLGYENTKRAFEESLQKLGTDYIDIYLIHQPYGDLYGAWRAMEELYLAGQIKAIGVSNFSTGRITDFAEQANIVPALNQIELHPYRQAPLIRKTNQLYTVATQAWSPFNRGEDGIFSDAALNSIAEKYNKTVAQIILRWQIQEGILTIPKSSHLKRMQENFNIFDFSLKTEDMELIKSLDRQPNVYGPREDQERVKHLLDYKV